MSAAVAFGGDGCRGQRGWQADSFDDLLSALVNILRAKSTLDFASH